jgi:N-methylhydantoinase A
VNEVEVIAPDGSYDDATVVSMVDQFESEYARLFGQDTGYADAGFTATGLKLRGTAPIGDIELRSVDPGGGDPEKALIGDRQVLLSTGSGEREQVPVYKGQTIDRDTVIAGPALIEFPDTTVVVHPEMNAQIDRFGSVVIEL